MDKSKCSGCYCDDYNRGLGGANECWSFKDAILIPMYSIHRDTPMSGYKKAWTKAGMKPNCFQGTGGMIYSSKENYDRLI